MKQLRIFTAAFVALNALAGIALVGVVTKPTTPIIALVDFIFSLIVIFFILHENEHH